MVPKTQILVFNWFFILFFPFTKELHSQINKNKTKALSHDFFLFFCSPHDPLVNIISVNSTSLRAITRHSTLLRISIYSRKFRIYPHTHKIIISLKKLFKIIFSRFLTSMIIWFWGKIQYNIITWESIKQNHFKGNFLYCLFGNCCFVEIEFFFFLKYCR